MPPMPPAPCASPKHSPIANKNKKGGGNHLTAAVPSAATTSTTIDDNMIIKTDETTAVADNTTTTTTNSNNPDGEDQFSASTRERARSHWTFIKSLHSTQKRKQLFKMGSNISLTTAEAAFLNMITKSQLDVDHKRSCLGKKKGGGMNNAAASAVIHSLGLEEGGDGNNNVANERSVSEPVVSIGITDDDDNDNDNNEGRKRSKDDLAISGRTHFSHLVQAAVAKENLRRAISARLSSLSGAEAKFLTKLVNNKSVSLEGLNNALHVLDNDPLYNKKLRKYTDDEDEEEEEDENEEEVEEDGVDDDVGDDKDESYIGEVAEKEAVDDGLSKSVNRRYRRKSSRGSNNQGLKQSMRRVSAIESSMLFDKMLDESEHRPSRNRRGSALGGGHLGTRVDDVDGGGKDDSHNMGDVADKEADNEVPKVMNRRYSRGSSRGSNNNKGLKQSMRRVSAIESSMLFDKMLDESEHRPSRNRRGSVIGGHLGTTDDSANNNTMDDSANNNNMLDGSIRNKRRSTVNERNVWDMATINRKELSSMSISPTSGGSLSQSERVPRSSPRSRYRKNRKTSIHEKSLWNLVEQPDQEEAEDEEDQDQATVNAHANARQQSLLISKSLSIHSLDEDEDGLPIKSTMAGEAIDPLLMAAPVEKTPMVTNRKTLPSVGSLMDDKSSTESTPAAGPESEVKVGLDELLTTLQPQVEAPQQPRMDRGGSDEKAGVGADIPTPTTPKLDSSFLADEESTEVTTNLLVCCGMEGISILDDMMYDNNNDKENANLDNKEVDNSDEDSLASKKKYLQLEPIDKVENEQHVKLSTWIGKPEDYPILGLGKKRKTAEEKSDRSVLKLGAVDMNGSTESDNAVEDGVDPLEPHVLSPLLMKCLREHFPYALREENFWLKYSLARDGASFEMIFSTMRHSQHTILAIETTNGEVFGSFTSTPWRANGNAYYGSCEAFVWMLRKTRRDPETGEETCGSLDEYILRESSLDVFQWNHGATGGDMGNRNVQLSNADRLFVGGGYPDEAEEHVMQSSGTTGDDYDENKNENDESAMDVEWGMALALDKDLLRGTSSRCATFASNPLIDSSRHQGSEVFEIMNIEIWALTPCMNEEMAEELELGRTFVMGFHK